MGRDVEGRPVEVVLDHEWPDAPGSGAAGSDAHGSDAEGAAAAAGPGRSVAVASRRRRRWLGAVAGVLLVVVVLGLVDARADRREREALAAAADVPGVLGSMAEPPRELWRLPVFPPLAAAGGVVVTADEPDVVGLDLATGERLWTTSRPVGSQRPGCPGTIPDDDGGTRITCFGLGPRAGGLSVLDPATGDVRDFRRASRLVLSSAPVDGDVVSLEGARSGLVATRHDLASGGERWSVAVDRGDAGFGDVRLHGDERVVAIEGATTVVLDARDGSELGRYAAVSDGVAPALARVVSRPGHGYGVWPSRFAGRWYAPDGTPGPALAGEPVEPELDDGTRAGMVLLRPADGDRLRAVDVATGAELWDRPSPGRVLLHLAGRLVVTGDGRLEGWDPATGDVAWSVTLDAGEDPDLGEPYTDGVRVLVRGEDRDGLRLTAYRIADGERVWRAPLPTGAEYLAVLGDRLAAVGRFDGRAEGAVVLG